jgi:ABC-type bacteriocin/lantibiotic exporter with double-glycine peptidase domain
MKYQRLPGWCGPAAAANALRCFGRRVDQRIIAKMASTDDNGTSDLRLIDAINMLGFVATRYESAKRNESILWLDGALTSGPVILCVDAWGHYLVCAGKVRDRYVLIDSTNTVRNKDENGVHVVGRSELMRRWMNRHKGLLFAIGVSKK